MNVQEYGSIIARLNQERTKESSEGGRKAIESMMIRATDEYLEASRKRDTERRMN